MSLEKRIGRLERFKDWARPIIETIVKQLELSQARVNPDRYCRDDLDRKIIDYLIEHKAAGTTEIAKALELDPTKGRHLVGKRIKGIDVRSRRDSYYLLEFHPEHKEGKFRAWWILLENIDIEAFRSEK